jgi:hypothetical protein
MKSDYIVAAISVGAMVVGLGAYSVRSGDEYCPSPSAASVATLFAPCQAFDSAMGHPVSKQEAVQMGLLTPDERPFPASESLRRADIAKTGRAHRRAF